MKFFSFSTFLSVSLLESDYEHEFLLALRLLSRVLHRLPLDRPDARDKVEKLQAQIRWTSFPGVHALLLKVNFQFFLKVRERERKTMRNFFFLGMHQSEHIRSRRAFIIHVHTSFRFADGGSNSKFSFSDERHSSLAVHAFEFRRCQRIVHKECGKHRSGFFFFKYFFRF